MAKFKSFRSFKTTGTSNAAAVHKTVKQFEDAASKNARFTSAEIGKALETVPLRYMELLNQEKDYLIDIINLEIAKANIESEDVNAVSNLNNLHAIRNIFNKVKITPNEVTIALQRMSLLELNLKNSDPLSKRQSNLISKARHILIRIQTLSINGVTHKDVESLVGLLEQDMTLGVKLIKETLVSANGANGKIEVEQTPTTINKYSGKLSKLVVSMVENELKGAAKTIGKSDLYNLGFSPSFVEDIEGMVTTAILGKKYRRNKRKNVSKTEYKQARSAKIRSAKNKIKNKKLPRLPTIKQIGEGAELPLYNIMILINEALSEQIKDNMGDSSDPPILLRNQTGRFSESAKLLTLTRSKAGVIVGTYTYQRKPYDVFLPGHKLGTTQRNPKTYVEGSIRELAIAIMKRKFPGLTLELV